VRKRLDTLALDMPPEIAAVLHAEAKAMAAVVDEFQRQRERTKMRSDMEVNAEIVRLKNALAQADRWSVGAREQLEAQVQVLTKRMTKDQIEHEWYEDETTPDYCDGDNELWSLADAAGNWLRGERGYDAPSEGL
jgi:hypothetical protein